MYIHWEKELELGNDLIDTQHRIMVLLCRKLDIAIKAREHALIHTELLMQLNTMLGKISRRRESPEDLLYFLNKWLGQHLAHEDLKIVEYARMSDRRPIGENLYSEYLLSSEKN